ncbi:hypothetical protein L1D44_16865 [Shewanella sp. Isolate13]|uniref:hypothetical protein n=1 Tax=Shewanella sp. Isolate13 TaxID=2908531 RepID=UPI001EFD6ED4|nr:hypothetical protein [Shewanella sp. Isolate13]MCG9731466.1 hypothetical protein [Shewanella sp. Isolate13]
MFFKNLHYTFSSQISPILATVLGLFAHLEMLDISQAYLGTVTLIAIHSLLTKQLKLQQRTTNSQCLGFQGNISTEGKSDVITD